MWITFFFFNCYLVAPQPPLGHSQGDSLTKPTLITVFVHTRPKGHQEPRNEVGSLSPAERLVGFELGTFQFLLQHLNPLGHSPHFKCCLVLFNKWGKFIIFLVPKTAVSLLVVLISTSWEPGFSICPRRLMVETFVNISQKPFYLLERLGPVFFTYNSFISHLKIYIYLTYNINPSFSFIFIFLKTKTKILIFLLPVTS